MEVVWYKMGELRLNLAFFGRSNVYHLWNLRFVSWAYRPMSRMDGFNVRLQVETKWYQIVTIF